MITKITWISYKVEGMRFYFHLVGWGRKYGGVCVPTVTEWKGTWKTKANETENLNICWWYQKLLFVSASGFRGVLLTQINSFKELCCPLSVPCEAAYAFVEKLNVMVVVFRWEWGVCQVRKNRGLGYSLGGRVATACCILSHSVTATFRSKEGLFWLANFIWYNKQ